MVLPLRALLAGRRRLPRPAARRLCPLSPLSAPLPAAPAARLCSGQAEAAGGDGAMLRHLARKLRASGPVTVAEYMREALTNPGQGYYTRRGGVGESGDFITSPEISQVFGEGGARRMEPGSALWCPATGKEAMAETDAQEAHPEHEEDLYCVGD